MFVWNLLLLLQVRRGRPQSAEAAAARTARVGEGRRRRWAGRGVQVCSGPAEQHRVMRQLAVLGFIYFL